MLTLDIERERTCCFTGHRPEKLPWGPNEDAPACQALKRRILEEVAALYQRGYRRYICGMAQGADLYFAEAVLEFREDHPDLLLEAAIPCLTQANRWKLAERNRYRSILKNCDMETLIQRDYDRYCMLKRNRYMVNHSSVLLAVYDGMGGGTMYTISYAMDQNVEVIQLQP